MKAILTLGMTALLAGCSLVTQPPSETKARRLEAGRASSDADARAQSEAQRLGKRGLTPQEARGLADAQAGLARR